MRSVSVRIQAARRVRSLHPLAALAGAASCAAFALLAAPREARAQGSSAAQPSAPAGGAAASTPAPPAAPPTAGAAAAAPSAPASASAPAPASQPEIVFTGSATAPAASSSPASSPSSSASEPSDPSFAPAASPAGADEPAETESASHLGSKQRFWRIAIGPRIEYVGDSGFDAFSSNDVLPAWSFEGTRTLYAQGRLSFAAGLALDLGGRSGTARGQDTGLFVGRASVPLEGRYHVLPWLYGFARLAPGAAYLNARLDDPSAPSALTKSGGVFTADLSAGASFLLGPQKASSKAARFWLTPELGYAWSTAMALDLTPEDRGDDPRPVGTTSLGELALRGPYFKVSAALTF